MSPGYAYERAPDQEHFLNRRKTKELFRAIFRRGQRCKRHWQLSHSSLYLDFLAGNQRYRCTPWGNPTRNIFGWQKPCYLLGEGYAKTYAELMNETDWDSYGTGKYEKCANCMVHSGYEASAVNEAVAKLKDKGLTSPYLKTADLVANEYRLKALQARARWEATAAAWTWVRPPSASPGSAPTSTGRRPAARKASSARTRKKSSSDAVRLVSSIV